MIWILLFLTGSPAHADTVQVPVEMKQKYDDVTEALRENYEKAQQRVHQAEKDHGFVRSFTSGVSHLWTSAKAKGRHALVYLDHQLHEKVIGEEGMPAMKEKPVARPAPAAKETSSGKKGLFR